MSRLIHNKTALRKFHRQASQALREAVTVQAPHERWALIQDILARSEDLFLSQFDVLEDAILKRARIKNVNDCSTLARAAVQELANELTLWAPDPCAPRWYRLWRAFTEFQRSLAYCLWQNVRRPADCPKGSPSGIWDERRNRHRPYNGQRQRASWSRTAKSLEAQA